jgi:hypothetical protein
MKWRSPFKKIGAPKDAPGIAEPCLAMPAPDRPTRDLPSRTSPRREHDDATETNGKGPGTPLGVVAFVSQAFAGLLPPAKLLNLCTQISIAITKRERDFSAEEMRKIKNHFESEFADAIGVLKEAVHASQSGLVH